MSETSSDLTQVTCDQEFDSLYPKWIQQLSDKHWTPVRVAALAGGFLAEQPGAHILDIGAGIGKFCLVAAQYHPNNHFWVIEQRKDLVKIAEKAKKRASIDNVTFIHGNFTELDLSQFDHFYFYNSFYENLAHVEFHIHEHIGYSLSLYEYYTNYLFKALTKRPSGTKLVTFHGFREVVPAGYKLLKGPQNTFLKYWIKE